MARRKSRSKHAFDSCAAAPSVTQARLPTGACAPTGYPFWHVWNLEDSTTGM